MKNIKYKYINIKLFNLNKFVTFLFIYYSVVYKLMNGNEFFTVE